jgi:hypothetical protein
MNFHDLSLLIDTNQQITDHQMNSIKDKSQSLFNESCDKGKLETAKWLYDLSKTDGNTKVNINAENDSAFRHSCHYGNSETAKWLYDLSKTDGNTKVNINAGNDYAFRHSCHYGHSETAKWLYDLSKIDGNTKVNINARNDYAFRYSCSNGHLETPKWVYDLSQIDGNTKVNINAQNDYAFRYSCFYGHSETAKWLCEIEPNYSISVNDNKITFSIRNIKTIIEEIINDKKMEEYYIINKAEVVNEQKICHICLSEDEIYQMKFNCNHTICAECFIKYDNEKCFFRCGNINPINLVKFYSPNVE